jgi:hypothetical protein
MVAAVLYWVGQLFGALGNRCTRLAGWCAAWALKCDVDAVHRVTPPNLPRLIPPEWRDETGELAQRLSELPPRVLARVRLIPAPSAPAPAPNDVVRKGRFGDHGWRPGHENTRTARNLRLVKPTSRS